MAMCMICNFYSMQLTVLTHYPPLMGLLVAMFIPEREPLSPTGAMMDSVHLLYLFPLVTVLQGGHQIQNNTTVYLFKVC